MDQHAILFRPLMSGFLDSRLSPQQVFTSYAHDLAYTSGCVDRVWPDFFPLKLNALLWVSPVGGYLIYLSMNVTSPQEGLWRLELRSSDQRLIFSMCFSIVAGPSIFIGAVQGGRSEGDVTVAGLIRSATKNFEGMRPHFLLFEVVRALATAWKVETITGVAQNYQMKAFSRLRKASAVKFSYDGFFLELGASRTLDGNWNIPVQSAVRDPADTPSRRRAMYRRRSTLLESVREMIVARLGYRPLAIAGRLAVSGFP